MAGALPPFFLSLHPPGPKPPLAPIDSLYDGWVYSDRLDIEPMFICSMWERANSLVLLAPSQIQVSYDFTLFSLTRADRLPIAGRKLGGAPAQWARSAGSPSRIDLFCEGRGRWHGWGWHV